MNFSDTINNTDATVVDGVNLEEIKEFARQFKIRRLSLGLTQTQVGQALSATEGPSYSQSAICRSVKKTPNTNRKTNSYATVGISSQQNFLSFMLQI